MTTRTVTIICANSETLRALVAYLERDGLDVRGTTNARSLRTAHPASSVVVFSPDDFPLDGLLATLEELRRESPDVVCVIVTKQPSLFEDGDRTIVIPKPAWGWSILEAIRGR